MHGSKNSELKRRGPIVNSLKILENNLDVLFLVVAVSRLKKRLLLFILLKLNHSIKTCCLSTTAPVESLTQSLSGQSSIQ